MKIYRLITAIKMPMLEKGRLGDVRQICLI
jgi:hypothetical protein